MIRATFVASVATDRGTESEVKGAWFLAARAFLEQEQALERVARTIAEPHRSVLLEPIPGGWYPEVSLARALTALRSGLAPKREQFVDAMDACTAIGISRFFRALLRIASPAFVLRQVPTMWRQIRRGAGRVEVETESDRARLAYSEFPWFADENYRLLTEGSLRAVVRTCTGRAPSVSIVRATDTTLDVDLRW